MPHKIATTDLTTVLPQLAAAYRRHALVPFLGAGMSVASLEQWQGFVRNLERRAETATPGDTVAELLGRSHRATQKLRRAGRPEALRSAICEALQPANCKGSSVTTQTKALAALRWPLVLTTNYDDLYIQAAASAFDTEPVRVLSRSEADCRRVLASLHEPGEPLLWALHGYLGDVFTGKGSAIPEAQLVVGHEEYRRVMHHENHFRRAFAEVIRNRSLLFLGCGLGDPDVLGFLDETLSLVGPGAYPHYAILFSKESDAGDKARMLQLRLGVTPIVLPTYDALAGFLKQLKDVVESDQPRQIRWAFHLRTSTSGRVDGRVPEPDLEIERGGLPADVPEDECVAVSAGEDPDKIGDEKHGLYFSDGILDLLRRHHIDPSKETLYAAPRSVVEVPRRDGTPTRTIAAFARVPKSGATWTAADSRNARAIFDVTRKILDWAAGNRRSVVHCQLIAAGDGSPYPPRVALAQMLRAVGAWHAKKRERSPRVVIHLVNAELLGELSAGKLDVIELLQPDVVRIWVEVHEGGHRVERVQLFEGYNQTIGEIARRLFVDGPGWALKVLPEPELTTSVPALVTRVKHLNLADVGLLPGSTLQFERMTTPV